MSWAARVTCIVGMIVGCGSSHHVGTDGASDSGGGDGGGGIYPTPSYGAPAILFGQIGDVIYRFEDTSGDGDYNEAGERTLFWQESESEIRQIVAVDTSTIVEVDNYYNTPISTPALLWIHDSNGDGSALDPGEASVLWSGALPGGGTASVLHAIARGSDSAIYVLTEDGTGSPQTIYRLVDVNSDGSISGTGEVTVVTTLPSTVTTKSIAIDGYGAVWFVGNQQMIGGDLYRVDNGTPTLVFDQATLAAQAGVVIVSPQLDTLADGSIVFSAMLAGTNVVEGNLLVALRDANHDHQITSNEIVQIWSYAMGDFFCSFGDTQGLPDGSLMCLGYGRDVFRLVDANADGTFYDVGEQYVALDHMFAAANGQTPSGLDTITAALK
jgi:hypothetical protein